MRTIRKARKQYKCDYCQKLIEIGEKYEHIKSKMPKYDTNEKQIGIEYFESRLHNYECEEY